MLIKGVQFVPLFRRKTLYKFVKMWYTMTVKELYI